MYCNIKKKDDFSLFKNEENLDKFLRLLISGTNIKTGKILILGGIIGKELESFFKIFPESNFFITDKSKTILNSIKEKYETLKNFSTYVVNAFDGSSLLDFLLRHGKFDLIIVCRLNDYSPKEVQLLHFYRFLYNHFLKKDGIFCIVINKLKIWKLNYTILKKKKPIMDEVINIENSVDEYRSFMP